MIAIDWAVDHWPYLLGAAVALLSAINAYATRHPDEVRSGVRRLALLALDLVSTLQSRGSAAGGPRGLRVKLPLMQVSPPPEPKARAAMGGGR